MSFFMKAKYKIRVIRDEEEDEEDNRPAAASSGSAGVLVGK